MGRRWVSDRGKDGSARGLGLWLTASGGRKIGQSLGKGIGPARSGGKKKKKIKGRREGWWQVEEVVGRS